MSWLEIITLLAVKKSGFDVMANITSSKTLCDPNKNIILQSSDCKTESSMVWLKQENTSSGNIYGALYQNPPQGSPTTI